MGKLVGYIRVSSVDQNTERQLDGVTVDKTFTDKASGKDTNRPELSKLKEYVREGDKVIVHSMDRLARNLSDLEQIVKEFNGQGIAVEFAKEGLTFTGDDNKTATLLLQVIGAVAQFERAMIKERQLEGIALAKKRGVYKGRKPKLTDALIQEIKGRVSKKVPKAQIARDLNISRETLYKALKASEDA